MAEDVPRKMPIAESEKECCFDVEEDYTNHLFDNSQPTSIPCLCSSDATTTSRPYSSWESCENHKRHEGTSLFSNDDKEIKKRLITQRFSASNTLPFGHEKQSEFVFRHYDRRDWYIEQYRYNHTFGGTGRSVRNAQIAQTLINYLKNGQLKFPVISGHDVNLVHSIDQVADSSNSRSPAAISPARIDNRLAGRLVSSPYSPDLPNQDSTSPNKIPGLAIPRHARQHEGDSLVLPKIKIKNDTFFAESKKAQSCKQQSPNRKRMKRANAKGSTGLVQFVADYRPTKRDLSNDSYWWNNNEIPYTGRTIQIPSNSKGRSSNLSTRSEDFALVGSADKKSKKIRQVKTSLGHTMSKNENSVHDLLDYRSKLATKDTIQCLMNLFVSDQDGKPDGFEQSLDTPKEDGTSIRNNCVDSRRQRQPSSNTHTELTINGSKLSDCKQSERSCSISSKTSCSSGRHRRIRIPIRRALPLSQDTVLLGAPYRTEDEHRQDHETLLNS